jgi:phage terminase large subunit-like protein
MSDIELKRKRLELKKLKVKYILEHKLEYYSPYPFQVEYHNDPKRHKSLNAGNKPGKTECGGADTAIHLTGRYPEWWKGHRFTRPIDVICGGKTNTKVRDLAQQWLIGKPGNPKMLGTMYVPKEDILEDRMVRKPGVPDAKDKVFIKHYTNGVYDGDSQVTFLAYDAEKEGWMGDPADLVWLDEEPPEDIMGQATRAIIATGGFISMTFTPENGRTVVLQMTEENWSVHNATWMDASGGDFVIELRDGKKLIFTTVYGLKGQKGHLTEEKVRHSIKGMLPHEVEMRILGEPMQGSGLIFSYPQDQVMCHPIEIPEHWPRIAAIDFGGISEKSHPSAATWLAHDKDNDIIYVYDCVKVFANKIPDVAARLISRPQWIPMMYPHDGEKTVASGGTVAGEYRKYGVNMFHTHVTNWDEEKGEGKGGIKIEPQLIDMNSRFADRRLRVFNTLPEIWEELRNFHTTKTAEGKAKIVDRDDDLIATLRYGCAMIRHAITESDVLDYEEDDFDEDYQSDSVTGY